MLASAPSLQTKIDSLQMEFQSQAQKFDNKEKEYKQSNFTKD